MRQVRVSLPTLTPPPQSSPGPTVPWSTWGTVGKKKPCLLSYLVFHEASQKG